MKPEPRQPDSHLAGTLSIAQLARRWDISSKEVRRLLRHQELQFEEIMGRIRIPQSEVERLEASRDMRQH
ncbi:MAG: helix-turn-helix domain-containing protein [Pirellulales bacterium]|nr:helix-turn-helix domain-containing protein [Pirellulales bacterium]